MATVPKSCFGNFVLGRESFVTSSGLEVATDNEATDSVTVDEGTRLFLRLTKARAVVVTDVTYGILHVHT